MFVRIMLLLVLALSCAGIYAVKTSATGQTYVATVYALATVDRSALLSSRTTEEAVSLIRARYIEIGGEAVAAAGPEKAKPTVRKYTPGGAAKTGSGGFGARASIAPKAPDFDIGG